MKKPNCICETFIADITWVRCPTHGRVGPLNPEKAERFYRLCMDLIWRDWFGDGEDFCEKESVGEG